MQLATAEGLTTAMLHEHTGRPLQGLSSSLSNLRRQGYIDSNGLRWSIRQAGRTALELARGDAAHLELDLRTVAGVRVTAYDAGKGVHRIDRRRCPVPFRHLAFTWIQSLYGTSDEPVRSSTVKNAATWVFIVLRFYADHYPNDDDLRHLDADVVREWVRAVLPQRQPTRDAYLDHTARRLAALVQFCEWIQMHHPSFLPSGLVPATLQRAGLAEVEAICEASPILVQTPALEPPNAIYVGQRYGNKGGIYALAGVFNGTTDRARLWLTHRESRILTVLLDGRARNRTEIAAAGGLNKHTPNNLLWKLVRAGLVHSSGHSPQRSSKTVTYSITPAGRACLASHEQWSEGADLWDLRQIPSIHVPPSADRVGHRIDFRLVPSPFRSEMKAFILNRIASGNKAPSLFSIKEWFAGAALFLQYYGDCFPDDVTLAHLSVNVIDTYLQEQLRRWKPTRSSHYPVHIRARLSKALAFLNWLRTESNPLMPAGMATHLFRRRLSFVGGKAVLRAVPQPEFAVVDPRSPEEIVEAEYAEDVWDLRRLPGVNLRPQQSIHTLPFSQIPGDLRGLAKLYLRHRVETEGRSPSSCYQEVRRLGQFLGWYVVHKPDATDLASLDLHDVDAYRKYMRATPNARGTVRSARDVLDALLGAQRLVRFLQRMELPGAPSKPAAGIFLPEVMPPAPKMPYLSGQIKYIPESVLQQIDAQCALFPESYFAVLIVLRASGFRISDVLDLRWDKCIWRDESGGRWLVGDINKTRILGHKVPIDSDVAAVIETQIEMIKQLPDNENPNRYLFPSPATERIGLPVTPGTISHALNAFVERAGICGPDGKPFRIHAHAFRHSKAVELINNGMSAVLVQHWLAHLSWDMTMVYARIREQTLQQEWKQTVAHGVLRLTESGPKIINPEEIIAQDEIELDYIRFNLDATRTEKGFCFKPRKMACPYVDMPCYTCRNFSTTVAFLPEFKQMEADLRGQIDKGKQVGQVHWVDKNERKLQSILPVIEVLEAGRGYSAMSKDEREYAASERAVRVGVSATQ
jgi:integrase/DNA-binding MarR family transcriptional regulator